MTDAYATNRMAELTGDERAMLMGAVSPEKLALILFPTEQCNFRCTYCYEDFSIGRMSNRTVEAVKKLIARRMEDLRGLTLSWFGGEPLLAKDILLDLSSFAQKQCADHGVLFDQGHITTNGFGLTVPLLRQLARVGQTSFQISLDGYGEVHDRTRRRISGKGTFDRVWRNLMDMRDTDVAFRTLVRVHVTPSNVSSVEYLIDSLKHNLLEDPRVSVFLKPVGNWGGPNSQSIETLDNSPDKDVIMERLTRLLCDGVATPKVYQAPSMYVCYAAKPNNLAIRADGSIAKCTVLLNDDRNRVGHINDDGTLTIDNAALAPWLQGFKSFNPDILACPVGSLPKRIGSIPVVSE